MIIKVSVSRKYAIIAIAQALSYENEITNRIKFRNAVRNYLWLNGSGNIDDHEGELRDYIKAATAIVNKYYH